MNIIEKIRKEAHQPMDFSAYDSSNIRDNTNSLSHVIGTTVTAEPKLYRIGMISGKKPAKQDYFSAGEVRELFLSDLRTLGLKVEELALYSKPNILAYADSKDNFEENQHLAVLIIQDSNEEKDKENSKSKIWGFHLLRYDPKIGWSSKKFTQYLCTGENVTWPSNWYDHIVGTFKITR